MKHKNTNYQIEIIFPKNDQFIYLFLYKKMDSEWKNAITLEKQLEFYHRWHNRMLELKEGKISNAIKRVIYPLYSIFTGHSFESKLFIQ